MTQDVFFEKYMSHLNEQQRKAVQTVDGATLLLAVPGSGKTTVLVTRLGYMVCCCGIKPSSILTMTYTVAATKEMQQRFASMFGAEYADQMEFRTINGLSAKIIDYYSRNISRRQSFDLQDNEGELNRLIGQIYRNISGEYATESTIKDIRTGITYAKNMMLDKEDIARLDVGVQKFPEIFEAYCASLKSNGFMDYDDQMSYALAILNKYPAVLNYYQEKYRYICVDESQDTSKIQHVIIRLLAQKNGNIFMVGDEDQSIYGFRAAYPDALMSFEQDYPGARVLLIEQNYRSTNEIVAAANAFVTKNRFRIKKTIVPTKGTGRQIQVIDAIDRATQYKCLFAEAQGCETVTAVLFRNNDSALPLIDMLERSGITYNCRQFDCMFFSHRIVTDVTDIINFAYDPHDADAFMRVYHKFGCGLSKKSAVYACEQSSRSGKKILEELIKFPELSRYARDGAINLMTLLPMITESGAAKAIGLIWNMAGYGQYVSANNLDTGKYATLCFLGQNEASPRDLLRRLSELREIIQKHNNSSKNHFLLSTIHSSKGLEYERVFLLDILDGTLPSNASYDPTSMEEIKRYEEARRLYYVGMTRAKNELYLFRCRDNESVFTAEIQSVLPQEIIDAESVMGVFRRDFCGKTYVHKDNGKGRVIAQCDYTLLVEYENGKVQWLSLPELIEQRGLEFAAPKVAPSKAAPQKRPGRSTNQSTSLQFLQSQMQIGRTITHNKFGKGRISNTDGQSVTIRFEQYPDEKMFDLVLVAKNGNFSF